MNIEALHAEQIKTLTTARMAYDLALAAYRSAPAGPYKEAAQQVHYAASDVVNLAQSCAYTTGHALRQTLKQEN